MLGMSTTMISPYSSSNSPTSSTSVLPSTISSVSLPTSHGHGHGHGHGHAPPPSRFNSWPLLVALSYGTRPRHLSVSHQSLSLSSLLSNFVGMWASGCAALMTQRAGSISMSITLFNKAVFVYDFRFSNALTLSQMLFALVFLYILKV
jgi:hypothetical protein